MYIHNPLGFYSTSFLTDELTIYLGTQRIHKPPHMGRKQACPAKINKHYLSSKYQYKSHGV